jgi:hypothetical protein
MSDPTGTARVRRYRNRKKRGEHLVNIRLTQEEIEKLAARGYVTELGVSLASVVEAFIADTLAGGAGTFG